MSKFFIIAKKEFLDTFRDKRTLLRMILIPLIAFPLILIGVTKIQKMLAEKEAAKILKVGVVNENQAEAEKILGYLKSQESLEIIAYEDSENFVDLLKEDSLDLGLHFTQGFDDSIKAGKTASFLYFQESANRETKERLDLFLDSAESNIVTARLTELNKDLAYIKPIQAQPVEASEMIEVFAKYAGGILPYIFIAFLFMGCMLPAIDLFAGEKERGTLETLLTSPVDRISILLGKMAVIVVVGLISATVALTGLLLSTKIVDLTPEISMLVDSIVSVRLFLTLYILLIPLAIFFAGVMVPISVYSKSFKEAQSILTPLNVIMVIPAMVGFIPGIELNLVTSFIPIVNVVLSTKAIIAGTAEPLFIAITFFSLILISAAAVMISIKQFGSETNVLR